MRLLYLPPPPKERKSMEKAELMTNYGCGCHSFGVGLSFWSSTLAFVCDKIDILNCKLEICMTIRSHQGYSCYWEEIEVESRAEYCAKDQHFLTESSSLTPPYSPQPLSSLAESDILPDELATFRTLNAESWPALNRALREVQRLLEMVLGLAPVEENLTIEGSYVGTATGFTGVPFAMTYLI
ncbi:uncharacterized protein IAS62_005004 [Cryptococcus decagattii]|uniref:Uncharacterized protein n=1 Tax=Cryptococcus decagattii TaxID=1859122 RepID=A0ABZ2AZ01_9TREE